MTNMFKQICYLNAQTVKFIIHVVIEFTVGYQFVEKVTRKNNKLVEKLTR